MSEIPEIVLTRELKVRFLHRCECSHHDLLHELYSFKDSGGFPNATQLRGDQMALPMGTNIR